MKSYYFTFLRVALLCHPRLGRFK